MAQKKSKKDKPANKAYTSSRRWEKNKLIKIARHKKKHPNDTQEIGLVPNYTRRKPLPYDFGASKKLNSRR